ncbi:MAG: IPT/TIG domain-containing protein [Armatimonadetes bacterium]|nr:IPT/TIG domain-containing protein [Armatimonadota bacterium]
MFEGVYAELRGFGQIVYPSSVSYPRDDRDRITKSVDITFDLRGLRPGSWTLRVYNTDYPIPTGRFASTTFTISDAGGVHLTSVSPSSRSNLETDNPFYLTVDGANFDSGTTYWVFLRDARDTRYQIRSLTPATVLPTSRIRAQFNLFLANARPGLYDVIVATDFWGTNIVGRLGSAFTVTSPMTIVDCWNDTNFPGGIPNNSPHADRDRQAFTGGEPGSSDDQNKIVIRILGNANFSGVTSVRLQSARGSPDNPRGGSRVIISAQDVRISPDNRIIDAAFSLDDDNAYAGSYYLTVEKPGAGGRSEVADALFELYYYTPRVTDMYTPPPRPGATTPPAQRSRWAWYKDVDRHHARGLGVVVVGDDFHSTYVTRNTIRTAQPSVGLYLRIWRQIAPGYTETQDDGVPDIFYSHTSLFETTVRDASGLPGVVNENECRFILFGSPDDPALNSSPGNHHVYASHPWAKQVLFIDGSGGDPRDDPGVRLLSTNPIFSIFLDYPNPVGVEPSTVVNTGVQEWQMKIYGRIGSPSFSLDPHMFAPGVEVQLTKVGQPDDPTNIRTTEKPVWQGRIITCTFPPLSNPCGTGKRAEPGYWSIIIRNTDNKWEILPNAVRVISPPPVVTRVVYYVNTKDNNPAQSVWNGPPSQDGETGVIYIYGDNFMPGLTVKFKRNGTYNPGEDPASQDDVVTIPWESWRILNKSELLTNRALVRVQANFWGKTPGAWDVEVVNDDGQYGILQRAINVLAKPIISGVSPSSVSNKSNATITIEGKNFWPGISVKFVRQGFPDIVGSNIKLSGKVQYPSPPDVPGGYTTLTCTLPTLGKSPGIWDAVLSNVGGPPSDIQVGGRGGPEDLEIIADPPIVISVSPNKGANSSTSVTFLVKGQNFFAGAKLKLLRNTFTSGLVERYATGVNVTSQTSLVGTFDLTRLEPGSWRVVVENTDGKSNIDQDGDRTIDFDYEGAGNEDGDNLSDEDGPNPGSLFYISALASIVRIDPTSNSNLPSDNPFTLRIYGSNFWGSEANGLKVLLRRTGYADIEATSEQASPDGGMITCLINATNAQLGKWSVVVANPESPEVTLKDAFMVTGPAPVVISVSPSSTMNDAVRRLVINGNNFATGAAVRLRRVGFAEIVGTNVVVTSATQMAADFDLIGKAPGDWDVVVTNPDGVEGVGLRIFKITAPNPVIASVVPSEASNMSENVNVVIQGSNFFPGCTVYVRKQVGNTLYQMPVSNVRIIRSDQIAATFAVKDMPAGRWDVFVAAADDDGNPTNGIGDSGSSGVGKFIVTARAFVTAISPSSMLNEKTSNPFTLTIHGTNFWGDESGGLDVRLRRTGYNDILATGERAINTTQITCQLDITGAAPGYWNLVVKNPESPEVVISNAFTVQAKARITKVDPQSAPNSDIIRVTITGSNFWSGCDIRLRKAGETDIVGRNVSVSSSGTLITCEFDLRQKTVGDWQLIVTNVSSPSSDPATFTITLTGDPSVSRIEPNSSPNDSTIDVKITGNNFMPTDSAKLVPVRVSGTDTEIRATNVTVSDSRTIYCRFNLIKRSPGEWKVVVFGLRDGRSVESSDDVRFIVTAKPTVSKVTPTGALNNTVVIMAIEGYDFMPLPYAKVRLKGNGTVIDGVVNSVARDRIECSFDIRNRRPMKMDVEVENTPTQVASLREAFSIQAKAIIGQVEPSTAENREASLKVTIVGDNIWKGATCRLKRAGFSDILPVAPPQVEERFVGGENKGSEIVCQFDLRGRAPGNWHLIVINPLSPESDPYTFTINGVYSPDYPEVVSIEPNIGANISNVDVTITGRFLYEGASVKLVKGASEIVAQNVKWTQDGTKLTCTLPLIGKEPGRYDLVVINTDGRSVIVSKAFTVTAPATITSVSPTTAINTNASFAMTIVGSNFWSGIKVSLRRTGYRDIVATSVNVISTTQLTCTFNLEDIDNNPANGKQSAAPGRWSVVVQNVPNDEPPMSPEVIKPDALTITAAQPTLTGINPSEGERDSTVTVTVTGDNLFAGASAALRKTGQTPIAANNVQVISNTEIRCTFDLAGAALGRWSIVVTNADGQSGMLADAFLVKGKMPQIIQVKPNQALKGSVIGVTVDGANFYAGISVEMRKGNERIVGTSTTLLSDKQVWARFDLRNVSIGDWDVIVRNADGQIATLQGGFKVFEIPNVKPVISTISPNNGDNNRSVTVTVTGYNFYPNATVKLVKSGQADIVGTILSMTDKDGNVANGNEELQCVFDLKGKAPGKWNLVVINANGWQNDDTANDDFTVKALAVITGVTPSSAQNTAKVNVTIAGANFWAGAVVKLRHSSGDEIVGENVTVADQTRIVCTFDIRGKLPGAWDVVVQNDSSDEAVRQRAFTVTAMSPIISSISPSEATNDGIKTITIDGNYFYSPTVRFIRTGQPDIIATNIVVSDRNNDMHGDRIVCNVNLTNAAIGRWNVVVINCDGKSVTLSNAFLVKSVNPPTVSSISPSRVTNYGTVDVTIIGSNFFGGAVVRIEKDGGTSKKVITATNVNVASATQVTATLNVHDAEPGNWDVVVVNLDGQSGKLPGGFVIEQQGAPQITSLSPSSAPNTGTATVTINGSMFLRGATVRLTKVGQADIIGANVTFVGSTRLTCQFDLRDRAPGDWNVVVRNPDGREGKMDNAFRITAPAPTVSGITPYTAQNTGVVSVTITGNNLFSGARAFLRLGTASIEGANLVVSSKTTITCQFNLNGRQPGKWDVVVVNTDGQEGRRTEAFTVTAPATLTGMTPNSSENNAVISVIITGSNLWSGASVILRRSGQPDIVGMNVQANITNTQLTCQFDLRGVSPGWRSLVMTNPHSSSAVLGNAFMVYAPAPRISSITPSEGLNSTSVTVKLVGSNFYPGMVTRLIKSGQAEISGTSVNVLSPAEATCTFSLVGRVPGKWTVRAVNADSRYGDLVDGFVIKAQAVVTAITPNQGSNLGAKNPVTVTISGSNFWSGARVLLRRSGQQDIVASSVTVESQTRIRAVFNLTGAATGKWDVVVINVADGIESPHGVLREAFTIVAQ